MLVHVDDGFHAARRMKSIVETSPPWAFLIFVFSTRLTAGAVDDTAAKSSAAVVVPLPRRLATGCAVEAVVSFLRWL
jgi:hypothetical protein